MKIGFDAKRYFHNYTGLGNYSRTVVKGLQALYPDLECVLFDEKSLTRTLSLGRKAAAQGCDLLHGLSNEIPLDAGRAGIPSVVTIHDTAWRTFPKMYHWADRHIYDLKYGWSCRHADRVIAISESTKRDIVRFYGVPEERIDVVMQPVGQCYYTLMDIDDATAVIRQAIQQGVLPQELDATLESAGHKAQRHLFSCVGSINSRKNLLSVIKALEMIPASERPLLLAVGRGHEYEREVREYIARHQLADDVKIVSGLKDQNMLRALYRCSYAMPYPSFYEGFGLPVVEASLQQTAVITSNVSSLPEAANGTALLIDPNSVDELHQAITQLLNDEDGCRRRGIEARQAALRTFDPDTLMRQLMQVYEKTV